MPIKLALSDEAYGMIITANTAEASSTPKPCSFTPKDTTKGRRV